MPRSIGMNNLVGLLCDPTLSVLTQHPQLHGITGTLVLDDYMGTCALFAEACLEVGSLLLYINRDWRDIALGCLLFTLYRTITTPFRPVSQVSQLYQVDSLFKLNIDREGSMDTMGGNSLAVCFSIYLFQALFAYVYNDYQVLKKQRVLHSFVIDP